MSHIEAVYKRGVFQPLDPVNLPEDQRVHLLVEPATAQTPRQWLDEVRKIQAVIVSREGVLPDSTSDIAADRMR